MSKILKNILFCGGIAGAALSPVSSAQDRGQIPARTIPKMAERGLTLEQVGAIMDRASFQPEFKKALRPDNAKEIRDILIANGLPRSIPVKDQPQQSPFHPGTTDCFATTIKLYYPNPPYSWPNNWRIAVMIVCSNDVGGTSGYWD